MDDALKQFFLAMWQQHERKQWNYMIKGGPDQQKSARGVSKPKANKKQPKQTMTGHLMWAQTEDPGAEHGVIQSNQTGQYRHDQQLQGCSALLGIAVGEARRRWAAQEKVGSWEKLWASEEEEKLSRTTMWNAEQRSIRSHGEHWKSEENFEH